MARLSAFFRTHDHNPSGEMIAALTSVAATLEAMADGGCSRQVYLSSLDPGVGKTQTISHFIRSLLESDSHGDVGVVLCVSRLDEIRGLVGDMQLASDQFSVLTSDRGLNALGVPVDQGRVLFTTHRMIEVRCDGRSFDEVRELHWNGSARQVRIWDEAILPGQTVTITRDEIASLLKPVRSQHPRLALRLEQLFTDLKAQPDGTITELPDFCSDYSFQLDQLLQLVEGQPESLVNAAKSLWLLGGKAITVRQDGKYGHTVLDYRDTLPPDIAPLLVLDASGRVRTVYRLWEERRGGLVRLPSAAKKYRNLTVHVWNTGGGKSAFARNMDVLAEGIASTIRLRPNEDWLVVHHKSSGGQNIETRIRNLLPVNACKVHFINWGCHDATNKFSHVSNVILAGTLFYRPSPYEALGRLASRHPSSAGSFPDDDTTDIILGEHRHLILQALCRGSVRRSQDADCVPCNAYIIASAASGIEKAMPGIFPGCRVQNWRPVSVSLKGKVSEAVSFIGDRLDPSKLEVMPFREVYKAINMDSSNFRRSVRLHPDFIHALAELGIVELGGRGFVRSNLLFPEDESDC
jgi:hypothetical protein